jgi:hypothetical protein
VISEIMYRPDALPNAEYIELLNISDANATLYDDATDSPWRLVSSAESPGIEVFFPGDPPITLAPGEYLLLVADREMCRIRYALAEDYPAIEWGAHRLGDFGDTLTLSRPGQVDGRGERHWICVDRVAFSDGAHPGNFPNGVDAWPKMAGGRGYGLSRIVPDQYGNDPNNWQAAFPSPGAAKRRADR